ncbi:MAG TPA: hypothetical protein VIP77_16250 [Jiangellaceae bacterium]
MSARSVALEHYRARQRLIRALDREAARLWASVNPRDVGRSWLAVMPRLVVLTAAAQQAAAGAADAYLDEVLAAQSLGTATEGRVAVSALAGIASDGRALADLLVQPAMTTLAALGSDVAPSRALASGQAALRMMVSTQVADAGRVADGLAMTARRDSTGYVRMLVGKSCSRCVILAGKWYRWNAGFRRHPRCDCIHVPGQENTVGDLRTNPTAYFNSLSHEEQNRIFTNAGAQAIRDGANMNQVVNARRGLYEAGIGSVKFKATREGATVRGLFGGYEIDPVTGRLRKRGAAELERRQSGSRHISAARVPRLTPEQIYREASGNRDEAIRLLRRFGYLV